MNSFETTKWQQTLYKDIAYLFPSFMGILFSNASIGVSLKIRLYFVVAPNTLEVLRATCLKSSWAPINKLYRSLSL